MSAFLRLCGILTLPITTFRKVCLQFIVNSLVNKRTGLEKSCSEVQKSEKCGSLLHIIYEAGFTAFVFGFPVFVTKMFYTSDNCLKAKLVKIRTPKQTQ